MDYILIILGFFLLVKGADFFVDGSSAIARRLGIPTIVIGLTIVAIGTSVPEAMVSILASLKNANSMSLSNVVGSNIFNFLIVLGVCAIIKVLPVNKKILTRDIVILIGVTTFLTFSMMDNSLDRVEGLILIVLLILYIFLLIKDSLHSKKEEEKAEKVSTILSVIYIIGGIIGIAIGGELVVNSATKIALTLGISETLIGLTIVAFGTSLPELVTAIVAVRKGEVNIAIGNVVGSCIFNIIFVLGISAVISPIILNTSPMINLIILLGVTILMSIFLLTRKRVSRNEGIVCVILYIVYLVCLIMNVF